MKWLFLFASLLCAATFCAVGLFAQEIETLDWDIDSIFDEPPDSSEQNTPVKDETPPPPNQVSIVSLIQRRGYLFDTGYEFTVGVAPGWYEPPWTDGWTLGDYFLNRYLKMKGSFSIDAQISNVFRVKSTISFQIPGFGFSLGDFFFDYTLMDAVFFRGGKYNLSWGISPNFPFTNILSRIPNDNYARSSFIFRADMPIAKGGIQALALTRNNLMGNAALPRMKDFGFGAKYNLALPQADLDLGLFYQEEMPLRGFFSIKTTLLKTEFYNEWLGAIDIGDPSNVGGAVNIGFAKDFLGGKLNINGELFYNAEKDSYSYSPETSIWDAKTYTLIEGLNAAVNLQYKPMTKGDPRFFLQALYALEGSTAQLVPGFRLSPLPHMELYLALPMALGGKDGYYSVNTVTVTDKENEDRTAKPLPFAVIFLVTLKGNVRYGHYN